MSEALEWLDRVEDWELLPLREVRELAAELLVGLAELEPQPDQLRRTASFLRLAGWGEASLQAAEQAFAMDPSWESAVVLAGSHRFLDSPEPALRLYELACRLRPEDLSVSLDQGDMLGFEQHRPQEASAAYARVLDVEPGHPWARPAWLYLQGRGEELLELAGDYPENPQAFRMALAWRMRERPFWGLLPPAWEVGEPRSAQGWAWTLAGYPYHLQWWTMRATRLGLRLTDDEPLLELLNSRAPLRVQLAAALIVSRTSDEWEGSARRDILLALLDEAHPAAVVAAARLAFDEPRPRAELLDCLEGLRSEGPWEVLDGVLSWFEPGFVA